MYSHFKAGTSHGAPRTLSLVTTVAALALVAPRADAQWLSHTTVTPGIATSSSFIGGTGAYAGTVSTVATNIVDGGATPGVPGVVSQNFSNLTPTFLGNYPTNPGGTFDFVSFAYNDSGDRFDIAMDFSGLSLGYLPAGTLISLLDVDIQEFMTDFQAYAPGMSPITTPWLSSPLPLGTGTIDYNLTGGDSLNSFILAGVTWLGNGYDVLGNPANQDSAFQGFRTTQDISKLRWHGGRAIGAVQPGGGGYGVAIMAGAVPEPGTLAIIGLGITGMVRRRRGGRR